VFERNVRPLLPWLVLTTVVGCGGPRAPVNAPMNEVAEAATTAPSAAPPDVAIPSASAEGPTSPVPPTSSAVPAPLPASATLPIARAIEGFYVKARPFECDFVVETFSKSLNARTSSRMHLVFVRPGELHAAFSTGAVVMVHAQLLTMADPNRQLVYQHSVPVDFCPSALAYAGGSGALTNHLSLLTYAGAAMNAPGLDCLVGTPVPVSPDVARVLLFTNGSGEVRRSLIVTPSGDRIRFDVAQCTMNTAPPPSSLFAPLTAQSAPSTPVPPSSMTRALP
jgi:hypothetical protein